jgi:hypothetical protein
MAASLENPDLLIKLHDSPTKFMIAQYHTLQTQFIYWMET